MTSRFIFLSKFSLEIEEAEANVVDVDNCHHVLLDEELVSGDQKSNFLLYK